jgi:hypothetical protein
MAFSMENFECFGVLIFGVRAKAPLWNEIRFCERATATSHAFQSVIIKADHSDQYEGA